MGQTLSEPVVEKTSASGHDERLLYGVSAMQGWRISMEDAHTTVLDLLAIAEQDPKPHASKLSFFGVFDGHGGDKVALFAGENIHRIVAKQDAFKAGNYEQALKDGFLATDRAILNGIYTDIVPVPASRPRRGCRSFRRRGWGEWHLFQCQRQQPNAFAT
jgi:protein phosphatase 2C family protein 2/3